VSKTEDRLEESGVPAGTARDAHMADGAVTTAEKTLPLGAYVPTGAISRYEKPKASVDPDESKSWIKRAAPIVMSHKKQWFADDPGVDPAAVAERYRRRDRQEHSRTS
jgi:hypothetical protein